MQFRTIDINKLTGADYNPRKISEGSFEKLQESLKTFGVCKPVIANGNGILIAGHQRTKAMKEVGIKEVPVYILNKKIAVHDEIRFNLMHNSIETENSTAIINNINKLDYGYNTIDNEHINVIESKNGSVLKEICKLLVKYGEWGSVVVDEDGNVIHNNDYAVACKQLNLPCLVYKMENEKSKLFLEYMGIDYGEYNYDTLGIKAYNQTYCQMNRLAGNKQIKSSLYETFVIPNINRNQRIVDFGAGKKGYVNKLKSLGYDIRGYEPHFKKEGTEKLDVRQVVNDITDIQKDISKNGLYDVVILDSVLNSITSLEFEHYVMLTCNSLLNKDGVFYTGTRSLNKQIRNMNYSVATGKTRDIEFFDKNYFSATFRSGVWTMQKFNNVDTLKNLCSKYFEDVKVYDKGRSNIWAICKKPKNLPLEEYTKALNTEFNMEYPNGYKHNKHKKIVDAILNRIEVR